MADVVGSVTPVSGVRASVRSSRGKSKGANWRRPADAQVAVIRLELEVSDPATRRRVEAQYDAMFRLRRAVQRDAQHRIRGYLSATNERGRDGAAAVRERLGLTKKGLEAAASAHVDRSRWMRAHITKALALHVADEVWQSTDRYLFADRSGQRAGMPRVGAWFDFAWLPGRARSHTKARAGWETWRLAGSLQGHLDAYATTPGPTTAEAVHAAAGCSVLRQPSRLPIPAPSIKNGRTDWWGFAGPLTVVFTGLPAGDLVLPVRLPQGAGAFPRLAHFLHDPASWHKIDLVRVQDPKAPGGWRYYAHLMVLQPGYSAPSTIGRRAKTPTGRVGGVDGNVSNLAIVSMPADPSEAADGPGLRATYVTVSDEQNAAADSAAVTARRTQRALDRSRRANNREQYAPSARQAKHAERRAARGLREKAPPVPRGPRASNSAGVPLRAYRRDTLTPAYRQLRAQHTVASRGASQAKHARAKDIAQQIVVAHGATLVTEHVDVRGWARRWGRGVRLFSPGMLLAALHAETAACGGSMLRAGTNQTALSQHCVCGSRAKKPLSQRTHGCAACGLTGDRDLVSAAMAATVTLTDPSDPRTARIDNNLRAALQRRAAAQQEGLLRSTASATSTTGRTDGSHSDVAAAGDVEERRPTPEQTRVRAGRRRTRRHAHPPNGPLRVNS